MTSFFPSGAGLPSTATSGLSLSSDPGFVFGRAGSSAGQLSGVSGQYTGAGGVFSGLGTGMQIDTNAPDAFESGQPINAPIMCADLPDRSQNTLRKGHLLFVNNPHASSDVRYAVYSLPSVNSFLAEAPLRSAQELFSVSSFGGGSSNADEDDAYTSALSKRRYCDTNTTEADLYSLTVRDAVAKWRYIGVMQEDETVYGSGEKMFVYAVRGQMTMPRIVAGVRPGDRIGLEYRETDISCVYDRAGGRMDVGDAPVRRAVQVRAVNLGRAQKRAHLAGAAARCATASRSTLSTQKLSIVDVPTRNGVPDLSPAAVLSAPQTKSAVYEPLQAAFTVPLGTVAWLEGSEPSEQQVAAAHVRYQDYNQLENIGRMAINLDISF